jgi:hypothetical protein
MRVVVWLAVCMAFAATLAHAEDDMAAMISQYRREHGLSAVKTDPQLTAIAERQAQAMAATGIMDHSVAGSFRSRIAGARTGAAAENIAVGSKTWAETFRMWQKSRPQCEPVAIRGRQRRGRGRAQRADPLEDLLGHGDRRQVAEEEGPQGHGGRRGRGRQRQRREFREPAHRAEEYGLQDFLLTRMATRRCLSAPAGPHEKTSCVRRTSPGIFFDRSDLTKACRRCRATRLVPGQRWRDQCRLTTTPRL